MSSAPFLHFENVSLSVVLTLSKPSFTFEASSTAFALTTFKFSQPFIFAFDSSSLAPFVIACAPSLTWAKR